MKFSTKSSLTDSSSQALLLQRPITTLTYRSFSQISPIKHMPSITLYSPNPTHQTLHESCSNTVYTTKIAPQNAPNKYKNFEIKTFSLSLHLPLQEKREKRAESSFPSTIEHTAPETISTPSERAVARVYSCIACRNAHPRSVRVYMSVVSSLSLMKRERDRNPHTHTHAHITFQCISYTLKHDIHNNGSFASTHKGKPA